MAVLGIDVRGTTQTSSAGTTLSRAPTGNVDAGRVLVALITTRDAVAVSSITDGAGNTWEHVASASHSGGTVHAHIWICNVTSTITTSTTITVTFAGSLAHRCLSLAEYSVGAGKALAPVGTPGTSEVGAAPGFGSASVDGLPAAERLYLWVGAKQTNNTTAITANSGWITWGLTTRSSSSSEAVIIRAQHRIASSTGETANPTLNVAGTAAVGLLVALDEVTPGSAGVAGSADGQVELSGAAAGAALAGGAASGAVGLSGGASGAAAAQGAASGAVSIGGAATGVAQQPEAEGPPWAVVLPAVEAAYGVAATVDFGRALGAGPYALVAGWDALVDGLTLNTTTGVLSGTPTDRRGRGWHMIRVADAAGNTASVRMCSAPDLSPANYDHVYSGTVINTATTLQNLVGDVLILNPVLNNMLVLRSMTGGIVTVAGAVANANNNALRLSDAGDVENCTIWGGTWTAVGNGILVGTLPGVTHPGLRILNTRILDTGSYGGADNLHGIYCMAPALVEGCRIGPDTDYPSAAGSRWGSGITMRSGGTVRGCRVRSSNNDGITYFASSPGEGTTLLIEQCDVGDSNLASVAGRDAINLLDISGAASAGNLVDAVTIRNNYLANGSVLVGGDYAANGVPVTLGDNGGSVPSIWVGASAIGEAAGTVGLSGAATGKAAARGAAAGSVGLSGSASGTAIGAPAPATGAAAGSVDLSGAASGVARVAGAAVGAVDLSGSGSAKALASGGASGTVDLSGSATGAAPAKGAASGTVDLSGSADADARSSGAASGAVSIGGAATGAAPVKGGSSGAVGLSGGATGTTMPPGPATGQATGSLDLTGTATGKVSARGQGAGSLGLSGAATGAVGAEGAAFGSVDISGSATAAARAAAAAAGVVSLSGAGTAAALASGEAAGAVDLTGEAAGTTADVVMPEVVLIRVAGRWGAQRAAGRWQRRRATGTWRAA